MYVYLALLFAAGALLPFQAGMNAELARYSSHAHALFLSFFAGLPLLCAALYFAPRGFPSAAEIKAAPWWVWLGGPIGIFYVFSVTLGAKYTGAQAMIGAVAAGQTVAALLADHYGVAGFPKTEINTRRLLGAALIAAGLWCSLRDT